MNNDSKARFSDPDLWIRLLYMILFAALTWLSRLVLCVIGLLQFLVVLICGAENRSLRDFSASLAEWTLRAFRFICFNSEMKPFPFDEWPEPDGAVPAAMIIADVAAPAEQGAAAEVQNEDSVATELENAAAEAEAAVVEAGIVEAGVVETGIVENVPGENDTPATGGEDLPAAGDAENGEQGSDTDPQSKP